MYQGAADEHTQHYPRNGPFLPSTPQFLQPSSPHSLRPSAPVPHSPSAPLSLHPSAPPCARVCAYKRKSVWYQFSCINIYIYIYIYIHTRTKSSRIGKYQLQIVQPIESTWSLSGSIHMCYFIMHKFFYNTGGQHSSCVAISYLYWRI